MDEKPFISILDELGRDFFTLEFDKAIVPGKKTINPINAKLPERRSSLVGSKINFRANFNLEFIDLTPLAAMILIFCKHPSGIVGLIQAFRNTFALGKKGLTNRAVPRPPRGHQPTRQRKRCPRKIALIIQGECSGWFWERQILRHAANDMVRRGYSTRWLIHPRHFQLINDLADSCVRALVIVGHGTTVDSPPNRDWAAQVLINRHSEILTPGDLTRSGTAVVPFGLAIIHACNQGRTRNRSLWVNALGVPNNRFYSWSIKLTPVSALTWQYWFF